MARDIHDHWFKEAKRAGWRSRAAFKLIEIDDKRKVLKPGDRVLDLGAAPGSWLQVAAERIGSRGLAVGIDLQLIRADFPANNIHVIQGDAAALEPDQLTDLGLATDVIFDVLLSDMAPATTGNKDTDHYRSMRLCHLVLDLATRWLRPGGQLVMKSFEGPASKELTDRLREMFETVRPAKPKASRAESREMFLVGQGRLENLEVITPGADPTGGPPPVRPGWGGV